MIVDTVNILTTYGLKQSWIDGILDLPPLKKTLEERGTTPKDIVFEEHDITVTLFGVFTTKANIASMVSGLETLIKAKQVHDISFPAHVYTCKGVFNNGIQTEVYMAANLIELKIKITVTE